MFWQYYKCCTELGHCYKCTIQCSKMGVEELYDQHLSSHFFCSLGLDRQFSLATTSLFWQVITFKDSPDVYRIPDDLLQLLEPVNFPRAL